MDHATVSLLLGSLNGNMTGGVSLVPGWAGNAVYMNDNTGLVDLGFHQSQCFHNPDVCTDGVTFAMWIKRDHGADTGYVVNTGAWYYIPKGNHYVCVWNHKYQSFQQWVS